MNRKQKRRQRKDRQKEQRRSRIADGRLDLKKKTDWALQLSLGCTLMTLKDLYPEFELNALFFRRLAENIHQVTMDSHDLEVMFKAFKDEYGFDIRSL